MDYTGVLVLGATQRYVEALQTDSYCAGILVPRNAREWLDLDYWVNWLNFW